MNNPTCVPPALPGRRLMSRGLAAAGTLTLAAALLAACATTSPAAQSALDDARQGVQTLESDPQAGQAAGKTLEQARDSLRLAEQASLAHRPPEEIIHLSYLAKRQAQIGEAQLAEARARGQIQLAQAQREQVLLQAREREAAAAEQKARDAQAAASSAEQRAQSANARSSATQAELEALQARQTERGMVLTLGNSVLFDTASDTLKPGATESLGRVAQVLKNHDSIKVRIEGHTDSTGSDDYNQALSERRAASVARELQGDGVPAERIATVGRGRSSPVATNGTASGRQQNRRVEIVFSDDKGDFVAGN